MEGLLKRLSDEGSEAENALRVIAFFDELISHRAMFDALVRSTARLIGAPAGFRSDSDGPVWSFDAIGRPWGEGVPPRALERQVKTAQGSSGVAWILPSTSNHALADLVLERMALAASIILDRDAGEDARAGTFLSRILDSRRTADDRRLDAQLLGFRSTWKIRMCLIRRDADTPVHLDALVSWSRTQHVRIATMTEESGVVAMIHDSGTWTPRDLSRPEWLIGVGTSEPVEDAHRSLESARHASRLCSQLLGPTVVDAATIGPLSFLGSVSPAQAQRDDTVRMLLMLAKSEATLPELLALDCFCRHASLRAAASELNLHHSSLASRLENISGRLGRDIRQPEERLTLAVALQLFRVANSPD